MAADVKLAYLDLLSITHVSNRINANSHVRLEERLKLLMKYGRTPVTIVQNANATEAK